MLKSDGVMVDSLTNVIMGAVALKKELDAEELAANLMCFNTFGCSTL